MDEYDDAERRSIINRYISIAAVLVLMAAMTVVVWTEVGTWP